MIVSDQMIERLYCLLFFKHDIPVLHDPEAPWCHAVDTPVGDPLVVADRDGEAAVVGAHHPDLVVGGAGKGQLAPLTRIHCLHGHPA